MSERHRFRLTLEYDGSRYRGWQSQAGGHSVQDAVERAIARMGEGLCRLIVAGRTDAGVHALGQVAHVDLVKDRPPRVLMDALNAHLLQADEAVVLLAVERAPPGFNARISAKKRHYRYVILNRRAPSALERFRAWHCTKTLNVEAMQEAAQSVLGCHDFSTFRASACQAKSPIRTLEKLDARREGDHVIVEASARSFLHHQVRSMVGSLVKIGRGNWPVSEMRAALEARDRARCGPVAPAEGLYFTGVEY
jgi:tRNA pseudouridine38-40 synthase